MYIKHGLFLGAYMFMGQQEQSGIPSLEAFLELLFRVFMKCKGETTRKQ